MTDIVERLRYAATSRPGGICEEAADEITRLRVIEQDAARYRYLRNRIAEIVLSGKGPVIGCWIDCENEAEELILLTGDDADAAIDKAMKA